MDDPPPVTCPKCGKENPAENGYCEQCHSPLTREEGGAEVPRTPPSPPSAVTFSVAGRKPPPKPIPKVDSADLRCKACGAPLKPTPVGQTVVCEYCGTAETVTAPPGQPAPSPEPGYAKRDSDLFDDNEEGGDVGFWGYRPASYGPWRYLIGAIMFVIFGIYAIVESSQQVCSTNMVGNQTCQTVSNGGLLALGALFVLVGIAIGIYTYVQYVS